MAMINAAKRKQLDHMTMYNPRNAQLDLELPSSIKTNRTKKPPCDILGVLPCPQRTILSSEDYKNLLLHFGGGRNLKPSSAGGTQIGAHIITQKYQISGSQNCGPTRPTGTQNRNNDKLSGINENVDTLYSDRTGISLPFHFPHYPGNYPTYDYSKEISDWDEFSDNAEFYNRNSNSAYRINPSKIRIIPNYDDKYYTNINDPNNLASKIPQTRSQSLDTYNYSPENIQTVSSDLKYDDNTYPSDTQLYDMFSSPVYY